MIEKNNKGECGKFIQFSYDLLSGNGTGTVFQKIT